MDQIPAGGGWYVVVGKRAYAVFLDSAGQPRVMDDACPHAGFSLSAGAIHDDCVLCGWHAWPFELNTGQCPDNRVVAVRTYPARIVDGQVQARVSQGG